MSNIRNWIILIVEDDEFTALLIQRYLEQEELLCHIASTGKEALTFLERNSEKVLVLLDYFLPDAKADELIRQLYQQNLSFPFIVITGYQQVDVAVNMMKMGAMDYIVKEPGYPELMTRVVMRAISQMETEERLKRSEKAIQEAEKKFTLLVDKSPVGIFINQLGEITYINPKFTEITGYELKDLTSINSFLELLMERDNKAELTQKIEEIFISGFENTGLRFEFLRNYKDIIHIELYLALIEMNDEPAIIGFIIDITERVKDKEAFIESENRYRGIVSNLPVMLNRFNFKTGIISFVNDEYCKYFSYKRENILGKNLFNLLNKEYKKELENNLARLSMDESITAYESFMETPKGMRWIQWTNQALFDQKERIYEIQSMGKDITEQKQAEENIRSLSSRLLKAYDDVQQHISQELHDGVGQTILAAKLNLKSFRANPEKFQKSFDKGLDFIDKASDELREVYNNLYPALLTELGLESAIRWLSDHYLKIKNIVCLIDYQVGMDLDHQIDVHVFRIIQEAFTNILKHSKANQVRVYFELMDDTISLEIKDNGVGIKKRKGNKERTQFGLENMKYRAELLGGTFNIFSVFNKGTSIQIQFPLSANS